MRPKDSISNQLSFYIFIAISFASALYFFSYYFYSIQKDRDNFVNGINDRTEYLSYSISENLWNLDISTIERILGVFNSNREVISIKLESENVNINLPPKKGNEKFFHTITKEIIYNKSNNNKQFNSSNNSRNYENDNIGERLGTLHILFTNEDARSRNLNLFITLSVTLVSIVLLVTLLLRITINRILIKPFDSFAHGFRKIADGDYDFVSKMKDERDIKNEFEPLLYNLAKMAGDIKGQMTKRKKVEQELIEASEQLEEKVKERTMELKKAQNDLISKSREAGMAEIATNVIHNVGNALNSINVTSEMTTKEIEELQIPVIERIVELFNNHKDNIAELIENDETGKKIPRIIKEFSDYLSKFQKTVLDDFENIKSAIKTIQTTVNEQQSYAKNILTMEMYSPVEILDSAIRMNKKILGRHKIKIIKKYSAISDIKTDRNKVLHVLINILSNARYAFENQERENRKIICYIRKRNKYLEYEILDNGVGILNENLTKIFNYGFTTREDGHGFGLHDSSNSIKQLKGELIVSSKGLGKGASFIVKIPYE